MAKITYTVLVAVQAHGGIYYDAFPAGYPLPTTCSLGVTYRVEPIEQCELTPSGMRWRKIADAFLSR